MPYTVAVFDPGKGPYGSDWPTIADYVGQHDAHTIARSVTTTRRYPRVIVFQLRSAGALGLQVAEYTEPTERSE